MTNTDRRPSQAKAYRKAVATISLVAAALVTADFSPVLGDHPSVGAAELAIRGHHRRRRIGARRHARRDSSAGAVKLESPAVVKWERLFDGKSLDGWEITNFGGEGEVSVDNESITLGFGSSLTGVTYKGKMPRTGYELRLEAMQVDGIDFFCGMTFPVADSYCSFIVGGWAGAVVGLSSIDGKDASENETTQYMNFKQGQWYGIRVRVEPKRIQCWIDDKQVVDQDIEGRRITTRNEVDLSQPFGIASWETKAALRKIEIRRLADN